MMQPESVTVEAWKIQMVSPQLSGYHNGYNSTIEFIISMANHVHEERLGIVFRCVHFERDGVEVLRQFDFAVNRDGVELFEPA